MEKERLCLHARVFPHIKEAEVMIYYINYIPSKLITLCNVKLNTFMQSASNFSIPGKMFSWRVILSYCGERKCACLG